MFDVVLSLSYILPHFQVDEKWRIFVVVDLASADRANKWR